MTSAERVDYNQRRNSFTVGICRSAALVWDGSLFPGFKRLMRDIRTWFGLFLTVACVLTMAARAETIFANDLGAKGDGVAVDTAAIQRALDKGAGRHAMISFRPGTYLIGSIFVKSGETLEVPKGVRLIGIQKLEAYPPMPTRVAGIEMTWPAALVNSYKQSDVKITGGGIIDGDGSYWWKSYWDLRREYEPKGLRW